ncbi:MAG: RHS repeat-associated core domain-containing protein [Bacteroidota bacterium]
MSNENAEEVAIHWDDFTVYHGKTNVVYATNYYPGGFTFNEHQRTASVENKWKFQSKEWLPELRVYDFGPRGWDPLTWRTNAQDILANKFPDQSSYSLFRNNPVSFTDPTGLFPVDMIDDWIPEVKEDGSVYYTAEADDNIATFAEQFNLGGEQARAIFDQNGFQTDVLNQPSRSPAGEGDIISGISVANVTGSKVLKMDWQSSVATDSRRINQILFAMEYTISEGQFNHNNFFQNIPYHPTGEGYGFGNTSMLRGTTTKITGSQMPISVMLNHKSKLPTSSIPDSNDNWYVPHQRMYYFHYDAESGSNYPAINMFIKFQGESNMKSFTRKFGFKFSGITK